MKTAATASCQIAFSLIKITMGELIAFDVCKVLGSSLDVIGIDPEDIDCELEAIGNAVLVVPDPVHEVPDPVVVPLTAPAFALGTAPSGAGRSGVHRHESCIRFLSSSEDAEELD